MWDAIATPQRLARWFLPVEGDLKLGGRYQLKGNAGGTITRCDTADGTSSWREPFPERPEGGIAVTDDGWLIAVGGQSLEGYRYDGFVVARRAADGNAWRLLARDLGSSVELVQRGTWVCFVEAGLTGVIHCFDAGKGIHMKSPQLTGDVTLFDIERRGTTSRLVYFSRGGGGVQVHNQVLSLALP